MEKNNRGIFQCHFRKVWEFWSCFVSTQCLKDVRLWTWFSSVVVACHSVGSIEERAGIRQVSCPSHNSCLYLFLVTQHGVLDFAFKCQTEVRNWCIAYYDLFYYVMEWKNSFKFDYNNCLITVRSKSLLTALQDILWVLQPSSSPVFNAVEVIHTSAVGVDGVIPSRCPKKGATVLISGSTQDLTEKIIPPELSKRYTGLFIVLVEIYSNK